VTRSLVCLTFDFDSVSYWIAQGLTTPTPISRGEFGVVAAARLVELFRRHGIATTWFVPGLTIDTYPDACRQIADAGHEIAHHGYDHVAPRQLSRADEADQLDRGSAAIERLTGRRPRGYRSPGWDLSSNSVELLSEHGFVYDSSLMGHDYLPYRTRTGDEIAPGKPILFGAPTSLVELPVSWSLDDFPHFEYVRGGGLRAASDVLENWLADFDYLADELPWGVVTYTFHPFVIGRGHRMKMLEKLIIELAARGAVFVTAEQAVAEFVERERVGRM
jgi:peptidoglycan-N-acetylglucosamine deacetylase